MRRSVLFLFKTCLTILCGEMALANYTLPFGVGAPFLPQVPYGPNPQLGAPQGSAYAQPPSRNPYSSPAYLPPADNNYREPQRGYEERPDNYYGTYTKETRQTTTSNNEFYGRKNEQNAGGQRKGNDYRGYENQEQGYPGRPAGFTRVQGGTQSGQGSRAQVHAVLDYDEDYYEDEADATRSQNGGNSQQVTPIQGPIFLKNGSVPVVPLYSYPVLRNGTFLQIPILWSALSVALGLEVRGQLIRGVPCVKRFHQLFCPTAGNTYPIDRIETFIDENKALMKRMYGDFTIYTEYGLPPETGPGARARRKAPGVPDTFEDEEFQQTHRRTARQAFGNGGNANRQSRPTNPPLGANQGNSTTGRLDACESKMEIVTPYWALNSAGKVRAVVNTMHFEQAIHQEVCSKTQTNRCAGDCGCEQKYKWHRLLAYDPDQDCAGIFMDWFLFPSCCVCRCLPN